MFMSSRVNENTSFCSILEQHLKHGPWNHQVRQFCEDKLDCLKLFIRKYPKVIFFTFTIAEIQDTKLAYLQDHIDWPHQDVTLSW